jgi:type IV pilus assembly protein PilM
MRAGLRSRLWAGLDVGTFSVKLLGHFPLGGIARSPRAEVPLPASGDAPASPDAVARAVAECFTLADIAPRSVRGLTLGVSGPDVIVKQISLPLLADEEVGPALRFEARKHLPFDLQSMVIDFQILGRYLTEKRLDVLVAAVPQERLTKAVAPLKALGIEPDIVDAAPLALTNGIASVRENDRDPCVLLDIGHTASHLTMYQKGEPYFSRRLEFGGATLTEAIAHDTHVPLEEAEEWKLAAGSDEPGFRVDWNSREMQAVLECLRRELVEELRRSFAFYRTLGPLPDPMKMWISGGSARLPGLSARLSELLGFPVLLFNPLARHGEDAGGDAVGTGPQFAQAFGLAQRGA